MPTYFFRICLLLAFLLCSGCLGGPKVDPPGIMGAAGIGESAPTTHTGERDDGVAEDAMDSGIDYRPVDASVGTGGQGAGTGGQGGHYDASYSETDAGALDDDDAGSLDEP
jgi:hypothetical protein